MGRGPKPLWGIPRSFYGQIEYLRALSDTKKQFLYISPGENFLLQIRKAFFKVKTEYIHICSSSVSRFYGVMVSTLDSESSDPSSNLGRTWLFFCRNAHCTHNLFFVYDNFMQWILLSCILFSRGQDFQDSDVNHPIVTDKDPHKDPLKFQLNWWPWS